MTPENTKKNNETVKREISKILYATDLSPEAPQAYQYVLFVAKQFGADITCLHVLDKPLGEIANTLAGYLPIDKRKEFTDKNLQDAMVEMLRRDEQDYIKKLVGSGNETSPAGLGIRSVEKVVYGVVEDEILKQADKIGADLIILGAHRKPNSDKYFNSLSKKVLRKSKVPVTIVPII